MLWIDTKLFIDPKLLEKTSILELKNSRESVLSYFKDLLNIIEKSNLTKVTWQLRDEAIKRLAVSEPDWLSIWYWNKSDKWTAIRKDVAIDIIEHSIEMLMVWISDPELIELLALFVKNFWPDSLSDLISHIIYDKLCEYTARVSLELGIKTEIFSYKWNNYLLPRHPIKWSQIIFLPFEILRDLPLATSWEEIDSVITFNQNLRTEWNSIVRNVITDKAKKIRNNNVDKEVAKEYFKELLNIYKTSEINSYSIINDDKWYYNISSEAEYFSNYFSKQKNKPKNIDELIIVVKNFLNQFQKAIERNRWANLLYHKSKTWVIDSEKFHNEDVSQTLFYILADQFCERFNIMLSGESDAWKWPVDFAMWVWYKEKVLVEIKKSDNWNIVKWFNNQLENYKDSENAKYWFYVILELWDEDTKRHKNVEKLIDLYPDLKNEKNNSEIFLIDARIYKSASKDNNYSERKN